MEHTVVVGKGTNGVAFGNTLPVVIIAGPCQLESLELCVEVAQKMQRWCDSLGLGYIFKGSFDKANRTSGYSHRGLGLRRCMTVMRAVKQAVGCLTTTDIHESWQAVEVADVVDLIQIPAMLARQTDLLAAAGATGLPVNIKKGQFMAPEDMVHAARKVGAGSSVLLTERGTTFGYHNLVVDMRGLTIMKEETGWPVIIDASHSVQQPSFAGSKSSGDRGMIEVIAKAAVASTPIAGVFFETHPDPDSALSDGATSVRLENVPAMLARIQMIDNAVKRIG